MHWGQVGFYQKERATRAHDDLRSGRAGLGNAVPKPLEFFWSEEVLEPPCTAQLLRYLIDVFGAAFEAENVGLGEKEEFLVRILRRFSRFGIKVCEGLPVIY